MFFLKAGDFACGVEDDDPSARDVVEGGCNGAAGIPGGCYEDGELLIFVTGEIGHEAGHEACAEVFECEGGAVE